MAQADVVAMLAAVGKNYGKLVALDAVDVNVHRGEVFALLGPNGAGKTTAISLLLGLLKPDAGVASLFGMPPETFAARRRIGSMLQTAGVPETLTIGELIELFRSYYPAPRTVADIVELAGVADLLNRRYGKLSGGQQRRAQLRWHWRARRKYCFSTNRPPGSTSKRARRCGERSAAWREKAARSC